jgi:radical SAM protein with 4Fe4S-binding SPASM domain
VVPCCFDKDAQHRMGDLKTQSFNELWRSARYHQFRNKVLQSRQQVDICANCSEGVRVWGK